MCRKIVIVGLVLFLGGVAALGWVLAEQRRGRQLLLERQQRLQASLDKLNRVVAGETDVYPSISEEDLQHKWDERNMPKETIELVFTTSIMCILGGGTIVAWWLLLCTVRFGLQFLSRLKVFPAAFSSRWSEANDRSLDEDGQEDQEALEEEEEVPQRGDHSTVEPDEYGPDEMEALAKVGQQLGRPEKQGPHPEEWGGQDLGSDSGDQQLQARAQQTLSVAPETHAENVTRDATKIALLLSDEESVAFESGAGVETEDPNVNTKVFEQLSGNACEAALLESQDTSAKLEDSLETRTENLEKQLTEIRQMADLTLGDASDKQRAGQGAQEAGLDGSEPLSETLKELAEQVAAIREYASQQQDRVTRFQDGYDWSIIKNFCVRVIRCVDNLESRIDRLRQQNVETTTLDEVKDELLFALESGGVEQFEPPINSEYRGQEKNAEAVKEKEYTNDKNLRGKIAKVIKPAYRYVISEENVKVVRPAQVKLYG